MCIYVFYIFSTVHDGIISYVKGETVSTEFDEKYIKQFKNLKKL